MEISFDSNKAHYLVVTGIIVKDGKYLITKRSPHEKAFPGLWTVPGGKLEKKDYFERPKDTSEHWYNVFENLLRREVMEETGLEIKNIGYVTSMAYIRPDGIPTIIVSLFADYSSGEVKLCEDLTEYAWVSLEEAKNYELIEGIYEELEMLDSKRSLILRNKLHGEVIGEWKKK
jgi:8-oxo-dGTP pyrophosphatase MutT (NUDIX family)